MGKKNLRIHEQKSKVKESIMNIFHYAEEIGNTLDDLWRESSFNINFFPELAHNTILNRKPEEEIDIYNLPFDLLSNQNIPKQRVNSGSKFGQPPLTLYTSSDKRFFIEIYLWSSVDMTIHDHPFSGAFSVIKGKCKHDTFTYERTGGTDELQIGSLELQKSEMLFSGDCRMILNGDNLIHRNLHLSRPTVTFIIRTYKDPGFTGMIFEESGLGIVPDLNINEVKYLDFLDGFIKLHNYEHAVNMIKVIIDSDCKDYAKFRSIEMYLETTRRYYEMDMLIEVFTSKNPLITSKILRDTFEFQRNFYLSNKN
ncbi:hypothetical protein [Xenorhabdus bovienii]|uniref:hypothetical protein n=1 Tax=Xenorhabdus bovienii TaxID=40576 RepID=UPI00237C6680|nr:hypothetical protein [Xenorhabdus bovienii]MDE1482046.1 hypothetical protein [Xenorhabdus bovienii]MDE9441119.1 hypothetical protein [Xenorhabdus bovienii]MDE9546569.1 hypothetical protein [Xenorhabdus bovienii]